MKKIIFFKVLPNNEGVFSSTDENGKEYSFKINKNENYYYLNLEPECLNFFNLKRYHMFKLFTSIDNVLDTLKNNFTLDIDSAVLLFKWDTAINV